MKHIICSSFGKDSNATALLALQHGEPLDEIIYTEVMFSKEISGELPEHTRFIYETAIPYFEKRGIPTRVLHAEKTYLDCFYHVVSRGNAQGKLAAFPLAGRCAIQRDCKVPPLEAYKKSLPPGTVSYLGIAADEPIRLERLKPDQVSLMAKYGVTEQDAFAMCRQEGLLSPLYEYSHRGGCWFCPNVSMTELRHLYRAHPDLWQLMLELQDTPNKATERFNRNFTFAELDLRFRLRTVDVIGAQTRLDMTNRNLQIETCKCCYKSRRGVTVYQNNIRLFFFQHFLNAIQNIGGHIKQCLLILHDRQIIVRCNIERFKNHIQHLAVLTGYANNGLEFLAFF